MDKRAVGWKLVATNCLRFVGLAGMGCGGTDTQSRAELLGHEQRFGEVQLNRFGIEEHEGPEWSARLASTDDTWHAQERDDYCWAACTQTVMSLHGTRPIPTQDQLWAANVANPLFEKDREAATFEEIRLALVPELRNQMPGYFVKDLEDTSGLSDLVREITSGEAVIVGLRESRESDMGHAYVVYGLRYRESSDTGLSFGQVVEVGKSAVDGVAGLFNRRGTSEDLTQVPTNKHEAVGFYLFDPDPSAEGGGLTYKSAEEVKKTLDFAISRASAREFLSDQYIWLRQHDQGPGVYVRNPLDRNGDPTAKFTLGQLQD